ncbi:MAG: AAA family ATPase [Anaerolineae bacterium]|nr:AAA family ATPase [Anaerolineae bacterium]
MSAEKFATLLTEGIYKIRIAESKNIQTIQDELGYALDKKGGASIEYWRKGHIPSRFSDIENLARQIGKRAQVERSWLEEFLQSAGHPAPEKVCDELFLPTPPIETRPFHSTILAPKDNLADVEKALFVAREEELAQLDSFLQGVLEKQQGRVVFVTGVAGSGKTALVEEFAWRAAQRHPNLVVAGGNCNSDTGGGDPYLPFREILALLTNDLETRWGTTAVVRHHAPRLRRLLPSVVQALVYEGPNLIDTFIPSRVMIERVKKAGQPVAELEALAARQMPPPSREFLREQATNVLRAIARHGPLLLVLDDLHWADSGSISLLFHLAKRLMDTQVLIIGLYRPTDLVPGPAGERHALEGVANELQRDFGSIRIDLRQRADRRFVDAIVDMEPNRLNSQFREALHRHTQGHALFTVEILDHLKQRGYLIQDTKTGEWLEGPTLAWEMLPAQVEGVIQERLGRLPANLQETLKVASVDGERFVAEVVAQVRRVDDVTMVRTLSGSLDKQHRLVEAEASRRLQPSGQRLSHYGFRHNLFQHYLYQSLDTVEQLLYHEQVGTALEQLCADQIEAVVVQLAHHFQKAEFTPKAITYLSRAGQQALQLSAYEEASTHFEKALALLMTLPETPERVQQELTLRIRLGATLIALRGYAAPEVERTYARAHELCQHAYAAESPEVVKVLVGLWVYYFVRGPLTQALALGEQLLSLAQSVQDPLVSVHAHRAMGNTLMVQGEFTSAQEHLEQGIAQYTAQRQGPDEALLYGHDPGITSMSYSALALWYLGYPDQALKRSQVVLALVDKLENPFNQAFAHSFAAVLHYFRREYPVAQAQAEMVLEISDKGGFAQWREFGKLLQGWALIQHRGQGANELQQMRQALSDWQATGATLARPFFMRLLGEAYCIVDQIESGLEIVTEALSIANSSGEHWATAELYRLQGALWLRQNKADSEVEASFEQALMIARRQQAKSLELRAVLNLSLLWLGQGQKKQAQQMLAEIYNQFTEGFDTADLKEAKALLEDMAGLV